MLVVAAIIRIRSSVIAETTTIAGRHPKLQGTNMRPNATDFLSEEAYDEACDEASRPQATVDDSIREYARNVGCEQQDREWLLTDYDSWVRNPFYAGPAGRHPEDWD